MICFVSRFARTLGLHVAWTVESVCRPLLPLWEGACQSLFVHLMKSENCHVLSLTICRVFCRALIGFGVGRPTAGVVTRYVCLAVAISACGFRILSSFIAARFHGAAKLRDCNHPEAARRGAREGMDLVLVDGSRCGRRRARRSLRGR